MTTVPTQIRDQIFTLLSGLPGYSKVRKVAQRQLQPEDMPCISVIRGDEVMSPDGDAVTGPPHFVHEATFHISIIRGSGDPVVTDGQSDADMDLVQETLLRSPALMALFEGITSVRRTQDWPQEGDTYYTELKLEITVQYRSIWNPVFTNDLNEIATYYPPNTRGPIQDIIFEDSP